MRTVALLTGIVTGLVAEGNPITKVLDLLESLEARVQHQGEVETKQYSEFAEWCEDQDREKNYEIEQGTAQSEDLGATIEQAVGQIANKNAEISDVAQVISANEQDLKAAADIRAKEHEDFVAEEKELVDTVDTLIRAQSVLSKQLRSGSLMQTPKVMNELTAAFSVILDAAVFSTHDKSKLRAFLQNKEDDDDQPFGKPQTRAYESHSGGILETLANMQEKAEGMLAEARKTELNAKHNFELLEQSLKNELDIQNKSLSTFKKSLAASKQAKAQAEGDKAVTDKDLAEDKKYVQDLTQNCKMRAQDAETSAASRAEELKALKEAKRIISEMTGGASGREYALVQTKSEDRSVYEKAADVIVHLGKKDGNFLLTQLGQQIRTAEVMANDPFAKVKGLIEQMIARLIKEAAEEADHKAFCDKELADNTSKRDAHQAKVDTLSTRIEKAQAGVAKLKQEVSSLQSQLTVLAKSQKQMDAMRTQEREEFVEAKKDYQDGLDGVRVALNVLRDYYAKNAAFVQQPAVGVHSKASDDATGIISLLEVSESDFARSLAEAQANEDQAQQSYDKTSQDNRVSKATKESDVKYKTQEIAHIESAMSDAQSDRAGVQDELDAVLEYLEKLRPQCTTVPTSYAERKARREHEIEGLKQALDILENQTAFAQQDSFLALKTVRRH